MFDNKKPTWGYGVCIAVVCEVLHMLMIFMTNMDDVSHAFLFVKQCTVPMVLANAVAVGAAVFVVTICNRELLPNKQKQEQIAQTFQRWLLVCIVAAYMLTSLFNYQLQNRMSQIETQSVLTQTLEDVCQDINDASDRNLLRLTRIVKQEYETAGGSDTARLQALAQKYDISEINVIQTDGIIFGSTETLFVGYDMMGGAQSAAFMKQLKQNKEFVQQYGPTSYDASLYRKYAGVQLQDGSFLQVGYDAKQFQQDIDATLVYVTKNRHIGSSGFLIICDENFQILTEEASKSGETLMEMGITIDSSMKERTIYEANIYGKTYLFSFTTTEGYYIIGTIPKEEAMIMRDASLYTSAFMEILIFVCLFLFLYFLIKRVIINNLKKINGTLAQITQGNLNVVVDVRSNEEFSSLSDDINSTVNTLKQYIAD